MADFRVTLERGARIIDRPWDSSEAEKRLFAWATSGDTLDTAKVSKSYLISNPDTGRKGDLHYPVGDIVDGQLVINAAALRAVRSRLGDASNTPQIPASVKERANDLAGKLLEEFNARADAERLDAEPDEPTIHGWLIEHYSHARKLSQPRIKVLLGLRDKYPYLRAPSTSKVYRGLSNVSTGRAGKLVGESDPTLDKSWTTSIEQAVKFANGEYIKPSDVDPGAVGAVMHGAVDPDNLLLDAVAIANIEAVAGTQHPVWKEPLRQSILDECEVVVLGPVTVERVELLPMTRADVDADTISVMLPIPPAIASRWPVVADNGEPHVTMVYVGKGSPGDCAAICKVVEAALPKILGEQMRLGDLGYFDNLPGSHAGSRAAYVDVSVSDACRTVRDAIDLAIRAIGIDVQHYTHNGQWNPHATLAYLSEGEAYEGVLPTGAWDIDEVQVWRGDERILIGQGRMDLLAKRGSQWVALSEDREHEFGTYATEAEARERLRQVEAAMVARADGCDIDDVEHRADRSEEEKASIRSRWSKGEGPNMGPARMREWLASPFAGPNRKTGADRDRARRVAQRALRVMSKSTEDWTADDYTAALQVMAFIARMARVKEGEPISIDGREGPSPQRASLMDWGFDPRLDADEGAAAEVADGARADRLGAPAIHTESRVHVVETWRSDKAELSLAGLDGLKPVRHPDGWVRYPVLYSRTGIQRYGDILEYRSPEEVFARESMESGFGVPWELRHSRTLLDPRIVRGVMRGAVWSVEPHKDGTHTWGWAHALDRELILAIEGDGGEDPTDPEVSVAYRCKVDRRPGHDDSGNPFHQRQIKIVWNSLASEPRGRAGSARVLTDRLDAADALEVHGAEQALELVRAGIPTRPVYYDLRDWVRYDSAASRHQTNTNRKDKNDMMIIEMMLAKHGKTMAELAEGLGVAEADLAKALEDETMAAKAIEWMMGDSEGEKPKEEPESEPDDGDVVMVEDAKYKVPKAVADMVARMKRDMAGMASKAEVLEAKADAASERATTLKKQLAERQDAMATMVSRQDADAMVLAQALPMAKVVELAKRGLGYDFEPKARQDADGVAHPVTTRDWQYAALRGAFGDAEADALFTRLDKKSDAARDAILEEKLLEAEEILVNKQDRSAEVTNTVNEARRRKADDNSAKRKDGAENPLLAAFEESRKVGAATHTNANGAQ